MLNPGDQIHSPGGAFKYIVQGPVCRLFDREELPWPSCSMSWKGKQPSWRRVGPRFVADLTCRRHPSYVVKGVDAWGFEWEAVHTIYTARLKGAEARWWYSRRNERNDYLPCP